MITQDELCLQWAVKYIIAGSKEPYVIFDVGSNVGDYIQLINSMVKSKVNIHSFEPNPKTFEKLNGRFGTQENVKLNKCGLGIKDNEDMTLFDPAGLGTAIASLYNRKAYEGFKPEDQPHKIPVRLTNLDSYVKLHGIEKINYLKIDVEGHELEVLKGAEETFAKGLVNVGQFEMGDTFKDAGITIEDFVNFFDQYGYQIYFQQIKDENIVRKTEDVNSYDNWENLLFVNTKLFTTESGE